MTYPSMAVAVTVIAFLLLWVQHKHVWAAGAIVSLISLMALGRVEPIGAAAILMAAAAAIVYKRRGVGWQWGLLVLVVIGTLFGLHAVPGINNYLYINDVRLTENAGPMSIWFNFDKAAFGLIVVGVVLRDNLIKSVSELQEMLARCIKILLLGLVTVYTIGMLIEYVHFQPKYHHLFVPWAIKNLFFTVIAEEIMFRGIIQNELDRAFVGRKHGGMLAVVVAGLLFGVAHFAGGIEYVFLSSIAGVMYGYVYYATKRIEAAFIAHFMLNALHFLIFTYPYLAI